MTIPRRWSAAHRLPKAYAAHGSATRRGMTLMEATVALSLSMFTVGIATQLMATAHRGHQLEEQRTQALRELDNALEMAFWLDASQLENAALETVARTTVETAQAAGTAPEELAITLTIADDPTMPARTKRIDAVASYREKSSGSLVTLPVLSIWRTITETEREATP
jgi:hypothetical protein